MCPSPSTSMFVPVEDYLYMIDVAHSMAGLTYNSMVQCNLLFALTGRSLLKAGVLNSL